MPVAKKKSEVEKIEQPKPIAVENKEPERPEPHSARVGGKLVVSDDRFFNGHPDFWAVDDKMQENYWNIGDFDPVEIYHWPSSRYETFHGRVFDRALSIEEDFLELGTISERLWEHRYEWAGDHEPVFEDIENSRHFLRMANGALIAALAKLDTIKMRSDGKAVRDAS